VERFRVVGGARLDGTVTITGAKNSALKLMTATLLAEGRTTLRSVPDVLDVDIMSDLLRRLGCTVDHDGEAGEVAIDVAGEIGHQADYDLVRRMRASINVLGPLLARCGAAEVALPGGDAIGSRGLDMHVGGLEQLGVSFESEHGFLIGRAPNGLRGAEIRLEFPSNGATENIMMAAVLAKGTTVIDNAAREPELTDVCNLLVAMGAQIDGIGSSTLTIDGVDSLKPVQYTVVPDRIVAGTYAIAAVGTGGRVRIEGARAENLTLVLDTLESTGARIDSDASGFTVTMERRPNAIDVVTLPYPGFPTDLQPMMIALASISDGTAMVTENVFESRFMFVNEMTRLGADIKTDGHHAVVRGRERLSGAPVRATDIRAGAGLVIAGLLADGVTTVSDARHVDRGYPDIVEVMQGLGADVTREPDPDHFGQD
jgi:UDP-N-acetylglucosamine 1-carboxyvinyltransferase